MLDTWNIIFNVCMLQDAQFCKNDDNCPKLLPAIKTRGNHSISDILWLKFFHGADILIIHPT